MIYISIIELLSVLFRSALGFVRSENWMESFVNDCRLKLSIFYFLERCIAVVLVVIKPIQDQFREVKVVSQVSMGMKFISGFLENTKIFIT